MAALGSAGPLVHVSPSSSRGPLMAALCAGFRLWISRLGWRMGQRRPSVGPQTEDARRACSSELVVRSLPSAAVLFATSRVQVACHQAIGQGVPCLPRTVLSKQGGFLVTQFDKLAPPSDRTTVLSSWLSFDVVAARGLCVRLGNLQFASVLEP